MNSSAKNYRLLIFLPVLSLKRLILQNFLDLTDFNQLQDRWPGFKSISLLQQLGKWFLAQQGDDGKERDTLWILLFLSLRP